MPDLYLTPAAIGYLAQWVLALALTASLFYRLRTAVRHNQDAPHLRLVVGIFVAVTVLVSLLFGDAALAPTQRLYAVYLENTAIGVLLILLLQFAYAFPQSYSQRRWEARLAMALSLAYTLWEAGFALYRGLWLLPMDQVLYRPPQADYAMSVLFLCVPLAFLRQMTAAAPRQPARRALRIFALIVLIPLALSLLTLAQDSAAIHPALFQSSLSAGILLTQFLFALNYLNGLPGVISFQMRLVGVMLLGVLALFAAVGWALTPPHAAVYRPALADQQTLRFTPNVQGGYDVTPVTFHFDDAPGARLAMDIPFPTGSPPDAQAAVPFTFPFYGESIETLWVVQSGAVGMGAPLYLPNMEHDYAATPAIFPLFVALDSAVGGVFAKGEGERLTITWLGLRGWHDPQATYTFQLVLHRDGVFTITTNGLPDVPYEPNTSPFSNVWLTGATPGLREQSPQLVNFADGPLQAGPQGILQDYYLEFRGLVHHLLAPLAVLILMSSIIVALGLPILFYLSLGRPLRALLDGVHRVKAGDLQIRMPVQNDDEIGFLTETFNAMVAQIRDLIAGLETRVAERTRDLEQANAQLQQQMDQRQSAQAQVVVQQRVLAAVEERERLARDLHDGLGQVMGYINVQAQAVQELLAQGQERGAQVNLRQIVRAAQEAHTGLRDSILGLRFSPALPGGLRETLEVYLRQFTEQHAIQATLSYPAELDLAFTPAVEEQILRIVQEALINVRKHAAATRVEVLVGLTDDLVQVIISDNGVGFDMAAWQAGNKERHPLPAPNALFPSSGHFGLGVMCERASQMGGRLEIRTAPGQGVKVLLSVPCADSAPDHESDMYGMRVLLVDDHPLFLDGLRNLLFARGINVIGVAHDGLEAQAQARSLRPNLIVMDMKMPRCNGVEATRAIKAEQPEVKIVMLTVSENEHDLFDAIKAGASGYLLKSLDANELVTLLAGAMRGEAPLPPALATRLVAELSSLPLSPDREDERGVDARGEEAIPAALTPRQWDILQRVADGMTYKEIAAAVYLSEDGVKYHMGRILDRLHLANREEAIAFARRWGDKVTG